MGLRAAAFARRGTSLLHANGVGLALPLGILFFKLRERPQEDATVGDDNEALRRSEECYCTVVENAKDYAITDTAGRIVDWCAGAAGIFRQHPIAPRQNAAAGKVGRYGSLGNGAGESQRPAPIWQDQG
jgi:hypothetical protein